MQVPPLQPQRSIKTADMPLEQISANPNIPKAQKLEAACRAFEAILLRQILGAAQKPVISSSFSNESATASIYRDLATEQMADGIARSGQFGVARSFLEQLKEKKGSSSAPSGTTPASKMTAATPTATEPKPSHGAVDLKAHGNER